MATTSYAGRDSSIVNNKVLRVGSTVTLSVKHSDGQTLPVGTYLKHDLAAVGPLRTPAVHEERFRTEHYQVYLADTALTQQRWGTPVCFEEEILLMDGGDLAVASEDQSRERRLWNFLNTSAWGSGYIAPRTSDTPGLLIMKIVDADTSAVPGSAAEPKRSAHSAAGQPVPLDSSRLLIVPTNVRQPQPLSVYRKSSSALAGGYLVIDGSGTLAQFRFRAIAAPLGSFGEQDEPTEPAYTSVGGPRAPSDPHLLHYGETVRLRCSKVDGGSEDAEHWLGNYLKHNLLAVGPLESGPPELFSSAGFTLWPTSEVMVNDDSMEYLTGVTYNQPLMIVDCESGLRWNVNTKTWNSGYLTVRDLDEAGGVCISLHRDDLPIDSREPVRFGDKGVYIAVHRPGYPSRRVTVYRTRSTALHADGGYLVIDGSGSEFEVAVCRSANDQLVEFSTPDEFAPEDAPPENKSSDQGHQATALAIFLAVLALYWIDSSLKMLFGSAPASATLILLNLFSATLAGLCIALVYQVPLVMDNLPPAVKRFLELQTDANAAQPHQQKQQQLTPAVSPMSAEEQKENEEARKRDSIRELYARVEKDAIRRRAENSAILESLLKNDPSVEVAPRFVRAEAGNPPKQRQRYIDTLKWRLEEGQDTILLQAHPHLELIKSCGTQYYHKHDKLNRIVYIERPKDIKLAELRKAGIGMPELLFHYRYITEYLWQVLDQDEDEGRIFSILDMKGIGLTDFVGEVIEFTKQATGIIQSHYPERSGHIFLVNASFTFSAIWKLVKTFLSKETLEKTHVYRSGFQKELLKYIPAENLPREYGGTCECPGGCVNSPMETQMMEFCRFVNQLRAAGGEAKAESSG